MSAADVGMLAVGGGLLLVVTLIAWRGHRKERHGPPPDIRARVLRKRAAEDRRP